MQALTNFFANLSISDPVVWLGIGTVLFLVLAGLIWGRKRFLPPTLPESTVRGADGELIPNPPEWSPPALRGDDRRRSLRRGGLPTPVHVTEGKESRRLVDGYVLDRSTGGVRLAVQKPWQTGSRILIRPQHSPENTPWVDAIVRNCREIGDYFEIGCQFESDLPWNVLLQFG